MFMLKMQIRKMQWSAWSRAAIWRGCYERWKRVLDVGVSLLALPFVLPVLGLCALAIRCTDGRPVFFAPLRTRRGGTLFRMVKFRTMVCDAEAMKRDLVHLNALSAYGAGVVIRSQ